MGPVLGMAARVKQQKKDNGEQSKYLVMGAATGSQGSAQEGQLQERRAAGHTGKGRGAQPVICTHCDCFS